MAPLIGLLLFFLVVIVLIVWFSIDIWKERGHLMKIWENVPRYEQKALIVGLLLFLAIPLLKGHSAHESYIPAVLIELVYSTAGALFVLGILAFLKEGHSLRNNNQKEKPNKAN